MSGADFWKAGDWFAICYECGRKRHASTLRRHWQGYYVCPDHWEERHPQDFVRAIPDIQTPPWSQPQPADKFVYTCDLNSMSSIPGRAGPGCMVPSRPYNGDPSIVPSSEIFT